MTMGNLTLEQRVFLVLSCERNAKSWIAIQRDYRRQYPNDDTPHVSTIKSLYEKFLRTGSVHDDRIGRSGKKTFVNTKEAREKVEQMLNSVPSASLRTIASTLNISVWSVRKILKEIKMSR